MAGSNKQIVYNNNGTPGGANVYYDNSNGNLGLGVQSPTHRLDVAGDSIQRTSMGAVRRIIRSYEDPVAGQWYSTGLSMSMYYGFSAFVNALYEDDTGDSNNRGMLAHVSGWAQGGELISYISRPNGSSIQLRMNAGTLEISQSQSSSTGGKLTVLVEVVCH